MSASPSIPIHPQALTLEEQPLSDMASSRSGDVRAGSALGGGSNGGFATGERSVVTPSDGQSFEMQHRQRGVHHSGSDENDAASRPGPLQPTVNNLGPQSSVHAGSTASDAPQTDNVASANGPVPTVH